MKKVPTPLFRMSLLALAIGVNASGAYAAETLDTIVVTAGKIEQDAQQTALSIQSLSEEKLADAGITSLADVAKFTPGLQLEQPSGGLTATIRVRGIGTPGYSALDPSVPIFIDGVAQGRTGSGFQDLIDIARVEVLRGPQGTLYGRNSTAGAINVWTKDASTNRWQGSALVQVGNRNDREFKGVVNVPMVEDVLGGRFSFFSTQKDGTVDNLITGKSGNNYADRHGARSKIVVLPADDVSIQWITDYSKSVNHPFASVVSYPAAFNAYATGGIVTNPQLSGARLQSNNLPVPDAYSDRGYAGESSTKDTNYATSVTVNVDFVEGFLADHSFTAITSYQNYQNVQDLDRDKTALEWARATGQSKTRSWSQEFRISSDAGDTWEYVAGLFYYGELVNSEQSNDGIFADSVAALDRGGVFMPGTRLTNSFSRADLRQDNAAVFGQTTYNVNDDFSITAGLRGSWVKKKGNSDADIDIRFMNNPALIRLNQVLINHQSQIERDLSGVLKARYFVDSDFMLYASYDRGFKPGGFNRILNASTGAPVSYKKENSNNFEIGAKTQWFDNHLQANVALFYMDFTDYHNQVTDPIFSNVIVENVKSVTSEGVEIDLQALLGDSFTTGFSATYLNPRVADDKIGNGQTTTSARRGVSASLEEGQLINDVSQYSANLFGEYVYPLDQGAESFVRADLSYRSRFLLASLGLNGEQGRLYQGGFTTANLRFGVRNLDDHWQIAGWVRNVTDKEYAVSGTIGLGGQTDGSTIEQAEPRTYGITVQYDY